ncbi:MAG: methylmalonyl Co-A mutase-associated GTPase MeaB [Gammaproteobacteria bacterium]|nr:methylmalonyl Co-A mutase-associated GTPase MeaB [Gammaproteobacteria bacterium]MCY4219035.1 methylmalonyl Co-A mutase-associated GTPase MeaB [Gammaproteobacteria bacterium]MCY4275436.1 methylmalonyl Co-A mutase-associated GTPase MeaB [Gammaproteobacteria bacterium]
MVSLDALRSGDRKTLAKILTLVESTRPEDRQVTESFLENITGYTGQSLRIGITGIPGVGKSTMIEALGHQVIKAGSKLAVLAVDPSSALSGGAILGDKTRMQTLSIEPSVYIRPSPAGKSLGGVARRTQESILVLEAAGYDVIFVETVGVGQAEAMVSRMTDISILMLLPGGGDDLQGIKRGVMELADIVVINKADRDLQARAKLSEADIRHALEFIQPRHQGWKPRVMKTSALEGEGISQLWNTILEFRKQTEKTNAFVANRQRQLLDWIHLEAREMILDQFEKDPTISQLHVDLAKKVTGSSMSYITAARELANHILGDKGL